MLKKLCITIAALLPMLAVQAMAEEPVPTGYNCDYEPACEVAPGIYGAMSSPVQSKFKLSIGGYIKLDYVYNSAAVGPFYPQGALPAKGSVANLREESVLTARQSRLWFKAAGPSLLGAKTNALIETDFFGYSSLSNEFGNMRMRLAYASLDWANTQVLFGQFWDIFGLAAGNTLDFRQAGPAGSPASPRVPQVRLTQKININEDNYIKLVLGVQNPVQDDPTGVNPGSPAANPPNTAPFIPSNNPSLGTPNSYGSLVNGAGQITFVSKALGVAPGFWGLPMNSLQLGVFGLGGSQKIIGSKAVDVYGYGFYGFVPVLRSKDGKSRAMTASLETQLYMAAGLNIQSANISQLATYNPTTSTSANKMPVYAPKGTGFLGQVVFYPTQNLGITAGYGRRNIVNSSDYAGGTERSQSLLFVNTAYDLNAAVRVAAEYEHGESQFLNSATGAASPSGQINSARLSVMYFF
jgi:hypothetical protein